MTNNLFTPIKFTTTIYLKPHELNKNYNDIFLKKIKKKFEGICSKHGYIKKDSIKIIKRGIGSITKEHFNGNILYDIQCSADICNPAQGSIAKCKVKNKNTLGLLAQGFYNNEPILEVIIPKISAGIISELNLDDISIGDDIFIEICGKKFTLYDKQISIIGKVIKPEEDKLKNNINIYVDDNEIELDDEKYKDNIEDFEENFDSDVEESDDEKKSEEEEEDEEEEEEEIDESLIDELDEFENIEDIIFDDE